MEQKQHQRRIVAYLKSTINRRAIDIARDLQLGTNGASVNPLLYDLEMAGVLSRTNLTPALWSLHGRRIVKSYSILFVNN